MVLIPQTPTYISTSEVILGWLFKKLLKKVENRGSGFFNVYVGSGQIVKLMFSGKDMLSAIICLKI